MLNNLRALRQRSLSTLPPGPLRPPIANRSIRIETPTVLFEDNHLLVVDKPTQWSTMGTEDRPTVHRWAADYLKHKYDKPGKVFVGIVSRLDTFTSGVLVLARTSKAASRLSEQFRRSSTRKVYLAVVEGKLSSTDNETLIDWVRKDDAAHRMRCVAAERAGAQRASLRFKILQTWDDRSLLQIELQTGRKHQIRVQFADRGHPVWGDRKYDARTQFGSGIALHSYQLTIEHPTLRQPMTFSSPPPKTWNRFGISVPLV